MRLKHSFSFLMVNQFFLYCRAATLQSSNETCHNDTVVQRRVHNGICSNSTQVSSIPHIQWRHSDSHYGFRTSSPNYGNMSHAYPHIHHQHLLPQLGSHTHQAQAFNPFGLPNNSTNHVSSQPNRYMLPCNSVTNGESSSNRNLDENYFSAAVCNPNLPRYMWGPPPPYSQPTSLENVNLEETAGNDNANPVAENNDNLVVDDTIVSGVSPSITSPSLLVASNGSPIRNNFDQQPNLTRTTKSGILLSPPGSQNDNMLPTSITDKDSPITSLVNSNNGLVKKVRQDGSIKNVDTYDESVDSAMHIYEQAKHKSGLPDAEVKGSENNSNSLPLRRMKKKLDLVPCKSEANLFKTDYTEEEHLVKEVRQKLNELGLYKYQKSKAARELAEIRQALSNLQNPYISRKIGPSQNVLQPYLELPKPSIQMQSLPLPPIPITSGTNSVNGANQIYQAPSIVSSACSTNENKYETIGKSINPYKITFGDKKDDVPFSNTTSPSDSSYGFIASSMSPMSIQTNKSSVAVSVAGEETSSSNDSRRHSPFPTRQSVTPPLQNSEEEEQTDTKNYLSKAYKCFRTKESSHYAQISPLRGHGAPNSSTAASTPHQNNHPSISYFRVRL